MLSSILIRSSMSIASSAWSRAVSRPAQRFREPLGQTPPLVQQLVLSLANGGNQAHDCKRPCIFDPFRPFRADLGQALQEFPQWSP